MRVNPALGIRPPKSPSTFTRVLSPEQANALLDPEAAEFSKFAILRCLKLFYSSDTGAGSPDSISVPGSISRRGLVAVSALKRQLSVPSVGGKAIEALHR